MLARAHTRAILTVASTCLLALVTLQFVGITGRSEVAHDSNNLLRLHVLANSDSAADQDLKLMVRDALIPLFGDLSLSGADASTVEEAVSRSIQALETRAAEVIRSAGYEYPVRVEIGTYPFPQKVAAKASLPAGEYRAVRVVIGSGQGQNWWCVLFPPLCLAQENTGVEVASVSSEQVNLDGVPVELRWRLLSRSGGKGGSQTAARIWHLLGRLPWMNPAEANARPTGQ